MKNTEYRNFLYKKTMRCIFSIICIIDGQIPHTGYVPKSIACGLLKV